MIGRLGIWLLCVVGALVALLVMLLQCVPGGNRFWSLARGFDQTAGCTFGGNEDVTISTRAGHARERGERWGCILCKLLDRIDPGHCDRSMSNGA